MTTQQRRRRKKAGRTPRGQQLLDSGFSSPRLLGSLIELRDIFTTIGEAALVVAGLCQRKHQPAVCRGGQT